MADRSVARDLLQVALNDQAADFRQGQWEAIDALVNRRGRLLVVQRTGWGKSSVYFIATRILRDGGRGPTLIVSPLLALMRNQIQAASRLGIRAETINSTNRENWPSLQQDVRAGKVGALLISPERLANDEFVEGVLMPISDGIGLLVVDEAHCISDWGHDFRPDYRRLANVIRHMPENVPVLGTTATANNRVIEDVRTQLGNVGVQRGVLMRETLALQNLRLPSQSARLAWLAEHVYALPGTGIIYTLTRRDADQVARWLQQRGISASPYYSDAKSEGFEDSNAYRQHLEERLLQNDIKALVATSALGMGYDKPDLGFVIHYQAPGSIVAYYQQVGRAGRGIDHAVGIMMSGHEDDEIHEHFRRTAFPKEEWVDGILTLLAEGDGLTARELEGAVNLRHAQIQQVLKYLSVESVAPIIRSGSTWRRTPVPFQMDQAKIQRLNSQRESEWKEVQAYLGECGCLMQFLAEALDDIAPQPCGKCASCTGRPVVDASFSRETVTDAARFLGQSEFSLECNKQVASGAFQEYDFTANLHEDCRANVGRVLSRWGDAGWGSLVAEDKHDGRFRDELVNAAADMLKHRWKPIPRPTWVTCVPSTRRRSLIPDYATRLAETLELPFEPVVKKIKENEPQKLQQNRYHQCRNLDGVFAISGQLPAGPVLLVDDVVDSKWTLTIVSALLRRAGSGPVWPFALATASIGS
ncbi:MAG: RecQ family ATP-dependent DNA helicase [Boseongicola sp. SB0662_bin_57]|nr:RecQ family ATP-dependent DNA helicase [Boseongicola sp. SB0662_bin_57]